MKSLCHVDTMNVNGVLISLSGASKRLQASSSTSVQLARRVVRFPCWLALVLLTASLARSNFKYVANSHAEHAKLQWAAHIDVNSQRLRASSAQLCCQLAENKEPRNCKLLRKATTNSSGVHERIREQTAGTLAAKKATNQEKLPNELALETHHVNTSECSCISGLGRGCDSSRFEAHKLAQYLASPTLRSSTGVRVNAEVRSPTSPVMYWPHRLPAVLCAFATVASPAAG